MSVQHQLALMMALRTGLLEVGSRRSKMKRFAFGVGEMCLVPRHVAIHPGEVLLAVDHIGSGHKWRLINDEPWKRAYVVFKEGANTHFMPDSAAAAAK